MSSIIPKCLRTYSRRIIPPTVHHFKKQPEHVQVIALKFLCATALIAGGTAAAVTYFRNRPSKPFLAVTGKEGDSLRNRFNFINKVVEKCAPAVVYIEIKDPRKLNRGNDSAAIVSNGSGFIVHQDGYILTNAHVVVSRPNATIEVKLTDGTVYNATVEDADMNIDLALIRVDSSGRKLPFLELGKSGDVAVGEWVVALGSPLSLSHSATAGVVSSVDRHADELGLRNYQMKYIQTDAPITFGNSGGPLVNLDGDVIGVNNLRITAGISFAIPIAYVSKFLQRIEFKNSKSERDRQSLQSGNELGLATLTLSTDRLRQLLSRHKDVQDTVQHGVLVWKIADGSTVERGGLKVGDIIVYINGLPIYKSNDVYNYMSEHNKPWHLKLIRKGQEISITM